MSIGSLADLLGVDREELVQAMDSCAPVASLSAPFDGEEEGASLETVLTEGGIEEDAVTRISVAEMLNKLNEDNRRIIQLRYFQNKTQTEVAPCQTSPRCRSRERAKHPEASQKAYVAQSFPLRGCCRRR
jgi:DNA-directed RNA polymerase specialized sigma subunit